jgi:hypothetical protein
MSFQGEIHMMKHNKLIAALATAGTLMAMGGAAHAISPAAALGLAAISGAAVGGAAAQAQHHHDAPVAVVPANPTVVMGAGPATTIQVVPAAPVTTTTVESTIVTPTETINYDHDGDGVLNANDRFPNDGTRS